jgi:hypothetical protein
LQGVELISTKDRSIGFVSLEDRLTAIRVSGLSTKLLQVLQHMMAHKDLYKSEFVGEVFHITLRCLIANVGSRSASDKANQYDEYELTDIVFPIIPPLSSHCIIIDIIISLYD